MANESVDSMVALTAVYLVEKLVGERAAWLAVVMVHKMAV